MRSIATNTISGPGAVVVAALTWWTSRPDFRPRILAWLEGQSPTVFLDRTDAKVGARALQELLFEQEFWAAVAESEPLSSMMDLARQHNSRIGELVRELIAGEVGRAVKESGWFDKNRRAVNAEKARLKAVRKVMES